MQSSHPTGLSQLVRMPVDHVLIEGMLELPAKPSGLVLFAHGSGSSRHSPRNNFVARVLRETGLGTLLMDLLTPVEDLDYQIRFDIALLTRRLLLATQWVQQNPETTKLPIGYFGASTGAAAALRAAAAMGDRVQAVVSRGGRPDLAGQHDLVKVRAPTLLLVGGLDTEVIELNHAAYALLSCSKKLSIVPGATHLFEEPGTLAQVASQAAAWFGHHLAAKG
ncbi:dienelactone hydrolase family protein [Rhodoferax sp.]|uniref:dienelactone hydrolase family protein n=1 Tax=Rhodoferax sp. TaxID=50421 RepID=UPI0025D6D537|nr:dienelactone hydrolase family protein [Rhodoferax sp.]MCM2341398.1 dienelactone hydrolase family protein [Rhodoferax sp.]